ncbi:hypothetical protein Tco_0272719 [Tanacetum coccineum]
MVSSLNNKIDFRISFDESDDEDYTVVFDKNSFSYKIISANDLKTDLENDNEKVNIPSFLSPEPVVSYFDDLDFFKDFENEFPAIVYNDALRCKSYFLTEPTLSPQHIDEFDLKDETSLSKCDEVEQNGLEHSDQDIADFEERWERIYDRGTHRVQVLDFKAMPKLMRDVLYARMLMEHRDDDGVVVFTSQTYGRVFKTRGPLVRELILEFLSTLRFGEGRRWSPSVLLGPPLSYTSIRDSVLRLCHRMMAHSIAGRSHASEKVTVTDLFYLRGMDVRSVNISYLLAQYMRRYAAGRKSGALISCEQFVARLAEHFGLLAEKRLQGLTVTAPALPIIDITKLGGVAEEALVAPGGGDEDE